MDWASLERVELAVNMRNLHDPREETSALLMRFGIIDPHELPDQRSLQSIPFEPHLTLDEHFSCEGLCRVVDHIRATWLQSRRRMPNPAKQEQFSACVELILLNLLRAEAQRPGLMVGIGTGKQGLDACRRYNPPFMSVDYFIFARDLLMRANVIAIKQPGYKNDGLAQVARYGLTDAARAALLPSAPPIEAFRVGVGRETILLKDRNGRLASYVEDQRITGMRCALERINSGLAAANIGWTREPVPGVDLEEGVRTTGTRLYRVFNNSTFEEGGRFYGGWWQHAKRHYRQFITINGARTLEADFKALHPSMLFAERGLSIAEDPYAQVDGIANDPALRDHAKRTFLALLNSGRGGTKEPRDFDEEKYGMTSEEFRRRVKNAFPMLPDVFSSGIGTRLQRKDSDLAERIMLHFIERDIPILPIHDSFIVTQRHGAELVKVMKQEFVEAYGQDISVSVKPDRKPLPA